MNSSAFPETPFDDSTVHAMGWPSDYGRGGLTKREHFAMVAMVAMVARDGSDLSAVAQATVQIADSVLAELAKETA